MKWLLAILMLCLPAAGQFQVLGGSADMTVYIRIVDAADGTPETGVVWNTAGIDLEYVRSGAAAVDITEATQTAGGAHTDGGFVHVGHGRYRIDLPDAAIAAGVPDVGVQGTVTDMVVLGAHVAIVGYDASDGVRLGLAALPNAAADAAGGLPISDAGGLDMDTFLARLDVVLSTRLATSGYTTPLNAAGIRTAVGLGTANLDTQIGDIPTNAELTARTLPSAEYGTDAGVNVVAGKVDTAQADLDLLTGTDGATLATAQANYAPAKAGDAMALTAGERTTLVDLVWDEAMDGSVTARTAIKRLLAWGCGRITVSGDVYTYYAADGTTALFTLTTAAAERTFAVSP